MKNYLLDTNIVSELRKLKPHGAVVAWVRSLHAEQLFISAVTMGELQAGVEKTRKNDLSKAGEIERWINQISDFYQVLPMDTRCFREWAQLMSGRSNYLMEDAMIAATARVHNLVVATRNERDFQNLRVDLFNPFKISNVPKI
jgi:predicted nucleic acid-binding protein